MEIGSAAIGGPQFLTFPPGIGIVDAPIHILGEKPHGIRDGEIDELAGHQSQYRAIEVTHHYRHVTAQAERVESINPGVVGRLGAAWMRHIFQLRSRPRIERPALRAMLSCWSRPVED